ncbi:TonB-dependent receptor [Hymenobacter psoromatis]|uniref:TonB-dependent receptor n=1 Tax=Hymenobacter psoromatis TaxID=1484116 RepID=UPI001CBC51C3|nr:TonB-dependent receptor [Hymenobacter psoromatis]
MPKRYPLLLTLSLLLAGPAAWAQQPAPGGVSGDFRGLPFAEFVRQVEAQTAYRFFFDPAATDTVVVRMQASGLPLPALLTQVLGRAQLHFALDEAARRVYVTANAPLQVRIPDDAFQPGALPAVLPPPPTPVRPASGGSGGALAGSSEFKLYEVGTAQRGGVGTGKVTLTGTVRVAGTRQPALGVAVYVEAPSVGVATDREGHYALTLPVGRYNVNIRGMGIRSTRRQVWLRGDGRLDLEVAPDAANLNEVVVEGKKEQNVRGLQMGTQLLDLKTIKQVPTVFGEADILRVVMTLPGVKTVGEGSTGLSVRGGGTDQNLVLYNDATIYNPAHLFGFFSAFNADVVKSVELYKSAIPAKYGGRLSSVLDIVGREGQRNKLGVSGGIGPLTSRLALEGPLAGSKGSFLVGGRISYADWLLHKVPNAALQRSAASFYDLNATLVYDLDKHNTLQASGYISHDRFRLASDTVYEYRNTAGSLKWKHTFGDKLQSTAIGAYSRYGFGLNTTLNPTTASAFAYNINQSSLQANFNYLASARHIVDFGASSILYNTAPGNQQPLGDASLLLPTTIQHERAAESAVYASDQFEVSPRFSVLAGLRYSFYQALGPRTVTQYQPGLSRSENTATGTETYGSGQVLAHYGGPEWRLSTRLELTAHSSIKASLTRQRQYIHQLSNTTVVSPTDSWKLSDNYIRPQVGDQVSLGYYHNFKRNTVEFSVEGYYKRTQDFLDYKSGAVLLLNPHLETDLVNGQGRAYGVEFLLRKTEGKINGWLSYTYARSLVQVNTPTDVVNGGAWYPSNYDKPHDVTLVGNYRFSRRLNAGVNFNYTTGRPITLPLAKYYIDQALRVYYSDRNAYRVPDYMRVDLAVNFEGNHKVKKLAHSSWTVGVYNLLGRKNPYSVYFQTVDGQLKGYKLSIFGSPIPTLTYNFRL